MMEKQRRKNGAIRYSEAFKMEIVRELESNDLSFAHLQRKYGIKGCDTVQRWAQQYGNGTRGKVTRVEKPGEINEFKRLRERMRRLETALERASSALGKRNDVVAEAREELEAAEEESEDAHEELAEAKEAARRLER